MTESTQASQRIHELDALRGIAALGVVFWHYGAHFHAYPLAALLHPFYNAGFLLVDFFFVLSGFVIARAYWKQPRQWRFGRNVISRLARLYPLHLFSLLVCAGLLLTVPPAAGPDDIVPKHNDARHFLLNLLLLNQSGLQDGWSFNTPAWSISTEFIINVFFLAFIALRPRARVAACAIVVTVLLVLAITQRPWLSASYALGVVDLNLARCSLGFGAGVAIHLGIAWLPPLRKLTSHPLLATLLGAVALVGMTTIMLAVGRHPAPSAYALSIAAAAGCVLFVPFSSALRWLLNRRPLVYLGDISYSTYLIHYPIQLAIYAISLRSSVDFASPLVLAIYVAAVLAVSALTHRYLEVPAQQRILNWRRLTPAVAATH